MELLIDLLIEEAFGEIETHSYGLHDLDMKFVASLIRPPSDRQWHEVRDTEQTWKNAKNVGLKPGTSDSAGH